MRKLLTAALAGAAVAGGAAIATSAAAQPYYYGPPPGYADPYRYSYRDRYYPYDNRYNGSSELGVLGSVLGSVLGLNYGSSFYSRVPVDQYGPDPNGMIGPDGRRIKCKLRRTYDRYYGGYVVQRECYARR